MLTAKHLLRGSGRRPQKLNKMRERGLPYARGDPF
jgi:hypothetical protein